MFRESSRNMEGLKSTTPHIDDIIYAMEQQSGKF